MSFSKRELASLLRQMDIVKAIGAFTKLKQRTRSNKDVFVGLCPLQDEKDPSFTVSRRGYFHCHGCGAGGDLTQFFKEKAGPDFLPALKKSAGLQGIKLEGKKKTPTKKKIKEREGPNIWGRKKQFDPKEKQPAFEESNIGLPPWARQANLWKEED